MCDGFLFEKYILHKRKEIVEMRRTKNERKKKFTRFICLYSSGDLAIAIKICATTYSHRRWRRRRRRCRYRRRRRRYTYIHILIGLVGKT